MNDNFFLSRKLLIILTIILSVSNAQPIKKDYIRVAFELGFFLSLEYDLFGDYLFKSKKANDPNTIDQYFRNKMVWEPKNLNKASLSSDFILYGLVLGSIPSVPFLIDKDNYVAIVLANIEVLAINGFITDIIKLSVGRQRPASFYNTRDEGKDSFKSFFSGHTSSAFAIGTSTAMMLSKEYPEKKTLIWGSIYTLASATGYFRIAADKHYLTDVLVGAIVGSSVGYFTQNFISKSYLSIDVNSEDVNQMGLHLNWRF